MNAAAVPFARVEYRVFTAVPGGWVWTSTHATEESAIAEADRFARARVDTTVNRVTLTMGGQVEIEEFVR